MYPPVDLVLRYIPWAKGTDKTRAVQVAQTEEVRQDPQAPENSSTSETVYATLPVSGNSLTASLVRRQLLCEGQSHYPQLKLEQYQLSVQLQGVRDNLHVPWLQPCVCVGLPLHLYTCIYVRRLACGWV